MHSENQQLGDDMRPDRFRSAHMHASLTFHMK